MINYSWEIRTLDTVLDKDGLTRVIIGVQWALTGEIDGITYTHEGYDYLNSPDPNNFVVYKELSEEDVVSWVETTLGGKLNDIKKNVEIEVLRKQGKIINLPKPWLLDPDLAPR